MTQPINNSKFVFRHPRKTGAVAMGLGLILFYLSFISPLIESSHRAWSVNVSTEAVNFGIALLAVGVVRCLFGAKALAFTNPDPSSMGKAAVFSLALLVVGVGAYAVLRQVLESRGYVFHDSFE